MHTAERVLILYSWNDDISERRFQTMQESPLVKGIPFEHCFALEDEHEHVSSAVLVKRVSERIQSFKPTVLLIHTGMAFLRRPGSFFVALTRLKDMYGALRFGYERHGGNMESDFAATGLFDESTATREMELLFFERVFGRE